MSAAELVVGVGASAGGLEAMLLLFGQVRRTGRIAYVVAQHMAHGGHTDLVVRVIQRESALPVHLGVHGQVLEADQVYVIPADHDGLVKGGVLTLRPPGPQRVSTPSVDVLLESIAQDLGRRGWAVVLSGAGWDGSRGCRAVQRAGGQVMVQDHSEAGFPSMPDAVIEAGCDARRMKAGQIGPWIERRLSGDTADAQSTVDPGVSVAAFHASSGARRERASSLASAPPRPSPAVDHRSVPGRDGPLVPDDPQPENLSAVMARVREVTGIDFSEYRQETLLRRLQSRRNHLELSPAAYEALLMRDQQEAQRLQRLFLVSLSSFWRDRECFESLGRALAPRLAAQPSGEPVRAWVPGCASGEEVYTLASMLMAAVELGGLKRGVEVVGTDLNVQALDQAQLGEYPVKAFREAPAGWAERWFTRQGQAFKVRPELVRHVRFVRADVEAGLPQGFSDERLDLVSCRNLLIYFLPSKQQRLLACFHQALKPDGLLLIGPSENLGAAAQASFRALDAERRIYVRRT